jgi:hypothetical protein
MIDFIASSDGIKKTVSGGKSTISKLDFKQGIRV